MKMSIREKIKAVDDKTEQKKAQYDLDRQTTKNSALSSGNFSKYEFLSGKDVLTKKDLLKEASALKKLEYSPLGKELTAQTNVVEKQYQVFNKLFKPD